MSPLDLSQIPKWTLNQHQHLVRHFTFTNFVEALAFVNQVGQFAELQQHHPDVHLSYGKVGIELWTHSKNAITEKDIAMAKTIDDFMAQLTQTKTKVQPK